MLPTYHSQIKVLKAVKNNFEELNKDIVELGQILWEMDRERLIEKLQQIVPEYKPWNGGEYLKYEPLAAKEII